MRFYLKFILFLLLITFLSKVNSQNTHESNFKLGVELFNNENYEEALLKLNKAILFKRNNDQYYYYRAKTRIALGKEKWATEDLKKAIIYNSNIGEYYSLLAYTSYQAEPSNFKKNIKYLELATKSVELDSNSAFNHYVKGKFNYLTKNYVEAAKDFTYSLLIDTSNAECYYYRGKARMLINDNEGRKDIFNAHKLNNKKNKVETKNLWNNYTMELNRIDSNFYVNPSKLLHRIDSISYFISFKNSNQKILSELGKTIYSLPINECKNKEIKLIITINKYGSTIKTKVLQGNTNNHLDSLIKEAIKKHPSKWIPYQEKGLAKTFEGVFTFGVRNVHFYKVEQKIKDEKIIVKNIHTNNHVYRVPYRITSYWVSRKVNSDYQKDCEDNSHYYNEGVKAFENEKYAIAKGYFVKALKVNHFDLDARFNLGVCYQKLGKTTKACECFQFCFDLGDEASKKELKFYCN